MYKLNSVHRSVGGCKQSAFTLIEVIIGIVVGAIALTFLSTLFFANPERSVEPVLQMRAAEFGQAIMDEILAKAYDETTPVGGVPPCTVCTPTASFGEDGTETRINYDDVDDYHEYCDKVTPPVVENAFGSTPIDFASFRMSICVIYDGDYDGTADTDINAKLITVDIYPPASAGIGKPITFTAYRGNF